MDLSDVPELENGLGMGGIHVGGRISQFPGLNHESRSKKTLRNAKSA